MSTSRQILKGGVAQLVLALGALALSSILITKLGKDQFAIFSMFFFVISVFLNFDNLPRALSVIFAREQPMGVALSQLVASARYVATIFGIAVGLLCAVAIWITVGGVADQSASWIVPLVAMLYVMIQTNNSVESAWLISKQQPGDFQLIRAGAFFVAQMAFVVTVFFEGRYFIAFLAVLAGPILAKIYMRHCVPKILSMLRITNRVEPYVHKIRKELIGGLVLGAAVVSSALADKILISRLPLEQVANYMLPTELVSRMCAFHSIVGYAIFSKLINGNWSAGKVEIGSVAGLLRLTIILFCFIATFSWIAAEKLFNVWIGVENASAEMILVFRIYILVFVLNGFGWIGFNFLSVQGRQIAVAGFYAAIPILIVLFSLISTSSLRPETMALIVVGARIADLMLFFFGIKSFGIPIPELFNFSQREIAFLVIGLGCLFSEIFIFYYAGCTDIFGSIFVACLIVLMVFLYFMELKRNDRNEYTK